MKVILRVMDIIEQLPPITLSDWRWWAIGSMIGVVGYALDLLQ